MYHGVLYTLPRESMNTYIQTTVLRDDDNSIDFKTNPYKIYLHANIISAHA